MLAAVLVATWTTSTFAILGDFGDLYVATHTDNSVIQFDVPTFTRETGTFATGTGDQAFGLVFSRDGSKMWVSGKNSQVVREYDAASGGAPTSTPIDLTTTGNPDRPAGLALSPDGSTLYVTDVELLTVTAYNTTTWAAGDVWTGISSASEYLAINAAGTRAYTGGSERIHEIDLTTAGGAATDLIVSPLGAGSDNFIGTGIVVHPVTGNILSAHRGGNTRFTDSVIEVSPGGSYLRTVVAGIDGQPTGLGISPDGSTLYAGHNACCGAATNVLRKYAVTSSGLFTFLGDTPAGSTRLNAMAVRVPEPATLAVLAFGGLMLRRRRA
ncbi:MAG: hypothetical protein CMJ18_21125 [Phycisphaeraceae bacterium]|nr:hypothetical protein [Phycisphaeraceae bacterium]